MSKLAITFPPKTYNIVLPELPAPYKIRPVSKEDLPHCIRLVGHGALYNNPLESAFEHKDAQGEDYAKVVIQRCFQDKLSFVIVNENEPLVEDDQVKAALKEENIFDRTKQMLTGNNRDQAASLKKLSPHYVGCLFAYDCGVPFPYLELPSSWEYMALYEQVFRNDLRKDPEHPYHQQYLFEKNRTAERKKQAGYKEDEQCCDMSIYVDDKSSFLSEIAVADPYLHKGFANTLCQAYKDTAFASGFTQIAAPAEHEAIEKIWKEFGAVECYLGYPNKVSKVVDGVETSHWKNIERPLRLFMLEKNISA